MPKDSAQERAFGVVPVLKKNGGYYFLLIHRLEGFWELPKGHAEEGEEDIEAAKREFCEETGIQNIDIQENIVFENKYIYTRGGKAVHKIVKYYLGFVSAGQEVRVQKEEVDDYAWAEFKEAQKILTHENSKVLLEKAHNALKNSSG